MKTYSANGALDHAKISQASHVVRNQLSLRQAMARAASCRDNRDVRQECRYLHDITLQDYRDAFDRDGVAARIIKLEATESWSEMPWLYETEDDSKTAFELIWERLENEHDIWGELKNVDVLSGIGQYGVLLVGLDDGKALSEPVDGGPVFAMPEDGTQPTTGPSTGDAGGTAPTPKPKPQQTVSGGTDPTRDVLYLRPFDEYLAPVAAWETNPASPRYGEPTAYTITFLDPTTSAGIGGSASQTASNTSTVHWHRVIHFADNTLSNKQLGVPRLKDVFDYCKNIEKIAGADAEGCWKNGVPGIFFEGDAEFDMMFDSDTIRESVERYDNGLDRYMAMQGVKPHKLGADLVDPEPHIMVQLKLISIAKAMPLRKLLGSEQGKLAADQDSKSWDKRMNGRRVGYLTPKMIMRAVKHLQMIGVLPRAVTPTVEWPEIGQPTLAEMAETAVKVTEAMSKYIGGGVDAILPEKMFFTLVLGWTDEQADAVLKAGEDRDNKLNGGEPFTGRAAAAAATALEAQAAAAGLEGPDDDEDDDDTTPKGGGKDKGGK